MSQLVVDAGSVLARFDRSPIGINLDYLMDNDANRPAARPIAEALREMGAAWLRYPGGGKSDSHLWSAPPFERPAPQVFGPYREYSAGSTIMDFDEYIATVRAIGAEPFVVVGHKPHGKGGIDMPTYLRNAVEWVRYSRRKGGLVRYWEIGNENWLNDQMTPEQAAEGIAEFSAAMKAEDPSILIGSNGFGRDWWRRLLLRAAKHLDFLTLSNYPCSTWMGYDYYRQRRDVTVIEQVEIAAEAIAALPDAADRERLFIILTELNSMDYATGGWPNRNNLGHALVTTEIIGRAVAHPKVRAAMLWNTRWVEPEPASIWYGLGKSNEILPAGRAVAVWGQFLRDSLVAVDRTDTLVTFATAGARIAGISPSGAGRGATGCGVQQPVLSHPQRTGTGLNNEPVAPTSARDGELNVILINKGFVDDEIDLKVVGGRGCKMARIFRFAGAGPDDMQPTWNELATLPVCGDTLEGLQLPAVSLTVVSLT